MSSSTGHAGGSLDGIVVLDLSQGVAGPYCTKLFALLGAEVIKVEPPGVGDASRRTGPFVHDRPGPDRSLLFLYLNTSKKSVTLDLTTATGQGLLRRLAQGADVVVESFAPGVLPGIGLGYETLAELNPRLVMSSVTYCGQTGPYSRFTCTDLLGQALSGNLQITGEPDREPVMTQGHFAEYVGGQSAFVATLMALYSAILSGAGQQVDCSITEALADLLDSSGVNALFGHRQPRTGMRHHGGYPAEIYPCEDGYVAIGAGPGGWPALAELIGREDLPLPRYEDPRKLKEHRDVIDPIIMDWLRGRTREEVYRAGQARRLPFAYLMTPEDMVQSPQLQARGFFHEVEHPATGPVKYPGPPFRLSETTVQLARAPHLGEHNEEVYGERLGLTPEYIVQLWEQGII